VLCFGATGCGAGFGLGGGFQLQVPFANERQKPLNEGKRAKLSRRSVRLFDRDRSAYGAQVSGAVFSARNANEREGKQGFEIAIGSTVATREGFAIIGGVADQIVFRGFDSKSYGVSLLRHRIAASLKFGPFEPEASFGASLFHIDAFHGNWNFSMLSPRASAGLGIQLGPARVYADAYTEYLWRWFGDDYIVRGISFGVRLGFKPASPFDEPTKSAPKLADAGPFGF
jgi:hypothetical protein